MDIKQIQELVKLINKTNIGEITIEEEGVKITVKQKKDPVQHIIAGGQSGQIYSNAFQQQTPTAIPLPTPAVLLPVATETPKADNYVTIKSPMIGTFYRQSGPDKPLFVNVGDIVTVGKVVCIIEAMKLFNEIESEVSGKIVKILVQDISPVEYDQPLFLVEPN